MNCEILHTLYVRSNGDVPCNDDAGESVLLGRIRPENPRWRVGSVVANHRYRHIRESLARGEMPWPDACRRCAFFRPHEPYADHLAEKRIRKIQVEPSLPCRLRCPGCSSWRQARVRPAPLQMDLTLFERLLRQLKEEAFAVEEIEYRGQGEPLLHPQFAEFVGLGYRHLPQARQRLITSGNFDYAAVVHGPPPNEIMVSCDGVFPENYARYRIGGRVETALQFMRDAVRSGDGLYPAVVWKYILFEWNDSPEEIRAAQGLAQEIGVTLLLFVYTHSAGKSRRYTPANPADIPIVAPNVYTNATPIHYRESAMPILPATG